MYVISKGWISHQHRNHALTVYQVAAGFERQLSATPATALVICAAICPSVILVLTPATLVAVSGRPIRASALSRDSATFFCDLDATATAPLGKRSGADVILSDVQAVAPSSFG